MTNSAAFKTSKYTQLPLRLTNSMGGKKQTLQTVEPGVVRFYSCGPTVYGPLHIGNARALVTADLFYRVMKHVGYDVRYVRNYTDVDDKIINKAKELGKDPLTASAQVAQTFLDYAAEDMKTLGLEEPTVVCRVTESMADIIDLITELQQKGVAYEAKGEVLYAIEKFPHYGKLSGKNVEDLLAGARVDVADYKKNPLDFSLWKHHKPGEPHWPSPWGEGRPGWHIECSAMARRHLGETIDLHHGGQDLIFPHHENEIAQSEAATGKPFCSQWVHNAFLTVGHEKMSKSLGNVFEMRAFMATYTAEMLRYQFVKHHYRSAFDFNDQLIAESISELERIYETKLWCEKTLQVSGPPRPQLSTGLKSELEKFTVGLQELFSAIESDLLNDLNTPGALGRLFAAIRNLNAIRAQLKKEAMGSDVVSAVEIKGAAQGLLAIYKQAFKSLTNVFGEDASDFLSKLDGLRAHLRASQGQESLSEEQIETLISERTAARKNKDFKRSDEIRNQLDAAGVAILDSPHGTTWKRK